MDRTAAVHEPTTPRRPIITALLLTLVAAVLPALLGVGPAAGADPTLTHVGAASSAGNRTAHVVRLPADVQAGDRLLLTLTTNDSTVAVSDPAGWTLLESRDGNGIRGRTWTRAAADADAGVNVTVTTAAATKSVLAVAAYRSSLGSTSVIASSSRVVNSAGTTHATAPVDVTDPGSWVVESWAEKSSSATAWSLPTGAVERTAAAFGGSGKISAVLADTGGAAAVGTHTAREATTDPAASRTVMTSVVLSPGVAVALPPVADFTSSCDRLACSFNALGSSDPDGDDLTYAWTVGDGGTATGPTPSHTYATDGTRTVTLTVSDGTGRATAVTRDVTVTAPPSPQAAGA